VEKRTRQKDNNPSLEHRFAADIYISPRHVAFLRSPFDTVFFRLLVFLLFLPFGYRARARAIDSGDTAIREFSRTDVSQDYREVSNPAKDSYYLRDRGIDLLAAF